MSLENFPTHFYYTTTPFSTTYEDMFDQLNSIISTKTTSYMVKMFSNNSFNNFTTNSNNNNSMERITTTATTSTDNVFESKIIIPLYVIIFVLAVVGNTLVLVTLIRNKRMRTVTNVYLLNLAVSDLLLGVFCMPFTLVGQVLRNFIFGLTMCKLIPYFQAVSVSVGVWTLVAISLERYFAICRPLKSRRWQTQFHAYKMIAVVWLASLFWSGPVLVVSSLRAMKRGHKCREDWPSRESEQIFNLFLDVMLLLIPMIIMSMAYSLIMTKLWKGLQREIEHNSTCRQQGNTVATSPSIRSARLPLLPCSAKIITTSSTNSSTTTTTTTTTTITNTVTKPIKSSVINEKNHKKKDDKKKGRDKTDTVKMWLMKGFVQVRLTNSKSTFHNPTTTATTPTSTPQQLIYTNGHFNTNPNNLLCNGNNDPKQEETNQDDYTTTYTFSRHAIRSNYMDKSIEAKKKVIRMLFVIVAEFFICWAPLHILNTWYLFYPQDVYKYVGSTGVALVQLLAYFSSCCNPITYCFMNRKFRQAFLTVFNCYSYCLCIPKESRSDNPRYIRNGLLKVAPNHSDASCNDSTVYVGRASTLGRSVVVLEAEDRV